MRREAREAGRQHCARVAVSMPLRSSHQAWGRVRSLLLVSYFAMAASGGTGHWPRARCAGELGMPVRDCTWERRGSTFPGATLERRRLETDSVLVPETWAMPEKVFSLLPSFVCVI